MLEVCGLLQAWSEALTKIGDLYNDLLQLFAGLEPHPLQVVFYLDFLRKVV